MWLIEIQWCHTAGEKGECGTKTSELHSTGSLTAVEIGGEGLACGLLGEGEKKISDYLSLVCKLQSPGEADTCTPTLSAPISHAGG